MKKGGAARRMLVFALIAALMAATGIFAQSKPASNIPERYPLMPDREVRNVVLFIGDGMGINHLVLSRLHTLGKNGWYNIERMPVTGFLRTDSEDLFTDSSAAATAMATGFKTKPGMIGILPDGTRVRGLFLAAKEKGMRTGIISMTDGATGATGAAFSVYVRDRNDFAEIARQQIAAEVDLLIGPGKKWFMPKSMAGSRRKDEINLLEQARGKGYQIVEDVASLEKMQGDRVLGFLAESSLNSELIVPITQKVLEVLGRGSKGFFLMIETDDTDIGGHEHDVNWIINPIKRFDKAVGVALDFALQDKSTLVIVTADHETGGLSIVPADSGYSSMRIAWATTHHSAQPTPLFAFGPHAILFTGMKDNTELAYLLGSLLDLPSFPQKLGPLAE